MHNTTQHNTYSKELQHIFHCLLCEICLISHHLGVCVVLWCVMLCCVVFCYVEVSCLALSCQAVLSCVILCFLYIFWLALLLIFTTHGLDFGTVSCCPLVWSCPALDLLCSCSRSNILTYRHYLFAFGHGLVSWQGGGTRNVRLSITARKTCFTGVQGCGTVST